MSLLGVQLQTALSDVPSGIWVIGVSGGADSVALLLALRQYRPDVHLVVAHLDHQMRGADSDQDRRFVESLAASFGVAVRVDSLEAYRHLATSNLEETFRLARLELFRAVVRDHQGRGVLLAHHADDRAETTLMRLLRGGEYASLDALRPRALIDGLEVRRPLLPIRRSELEAFLRERGQGWRQDASNHSPQFARNRVRMLLHENPARVSRLLRFADAVGELHRWVGANTPAIAENLNTSSLCDLPDLLARRALRVWLRDQGVETSAIAPVLIERLLHLARDASLPATVNLPGGFIVKRHRARLSASRANR